MSTALAEPVVCATPHFALEKSDLVRELQIAIGAVEKKTTIPILGNVKLEAAGDGLKITATDLEMAVVSRCTASIKAEGEATLPAKRLLDYVRLLPEGAVEIKFTANGWANITAGRAKTRIAGMSTESFPDVPTSGQPLCRIPLVPLTVMIERVLFAVSMEESRFTLHGALFEAAGDTVRMVATDGHRLALVEAKANVTTPGRVVIPRGALQQIQRMETVAPVGTEIEIGWDDNHIFFAVDGRTLTSRRVSGAFPDYERVLPKEFDRSAIVERQALRDSLARVRNFTDERSRAVRLKLSDGQMGIFASTADTGESEESIAAELTGEALEIGFNAQYLIDYCDVAGMDKIEIKCGGPDKAMQMQPAGAGDMRSLAVVMPMRI